MVSVCIATYNGEKYLKDQLRSILNQISCMDEIIISDDGSTDNTISIIESFKDSRIHIYKNLGSHGFKNNFENGLKYCKGDVIFLSDQDDVWLSNKYDKMCSIINEYDLVVSDSTVTDENLNTIFPSFFQYFGSGPGILKNIIRSSYYGSCMAFNRKILDYSIPFPKTQEIGHDLWLGLIAELKGTVTFYPQPLIYYRRHENTFSSISLSLNRSNRSLIKKCYSRIVIIFEVLKFILRKWHS